MVKPRNSGNMVQFLYNYYFPHPRVTYDEFKPKSPKSGQFWPYGHFYGVLGCLLGAYPPNFGYHVQASFKISFLHTLESRMPNFSPKVPKMTNFGLYDHFYGMLGL